MNDPAHETHLREKNFVLPPFQKLAAAIFIFLAIRHFHPAEGLVPLGLALLFTIAFLWFTEALPLAITALLVPILTTGTGILTVKESLANFGNPLDLPLSWRIRYRRRPLPPGP